MYMYMYMYILCGYPYVHTSSEMFRCAKDTVRFNCDWNRSKEIVLMAVTGRQWHVLAGFL